MRNSKSSSPALLMLSGTSVCRRTEIDTHCKVRSDLLARIEELEKENKRLVCVHVYAVCTCVRTCMWHVHVCIITCDLHVIL